MSRVYLPAPLPNTFAAAKEDIEYAAAFAALDQAVEGSGRGEAVALRYSTCRNVYLTINALFVELREVLGRGKNRSLLSEAVERLRAVIRQPVSQMNRDSVKALDAPAGEIGLRMAEFGRKRDVWTNRAELDSAFEKAIDGLGDALTADRVRRIIANSRTFQDEDHLSEGWDSRWYEVSQQEDGYAAERLDLLDRAAATVRAVTAVALAAGRAWRFALNPLHRTPSPADLFPAEGPAEADAGAARDPWADLHRELCANAGPLRLASADKTAVQPVAWHRPDDGPVHLPATVPAATEAGEILLKLCEHLEICGGELYQSLSEMFRPNLGRAPLPPPFKIDLSDAFAVKTHSPRLADALGRTVIRRYGRTAPDAITVGVCRFGVPACYYDGHHFRYVSTDRRQEVEKLARASVDALAGSPSPVLVLPELFLPASKAEHVAAYARERKVTLIAGVEPTESPDGPLNRAVIALPHVPINITQPKARNSPYEVQFNYRSSAAFVLGGTDIGSFAVVVCSDYREFDLLAAIASADFLIDTLFVCSCNPQPELFKAFAVADAARLYCHVVIANNCLGAGSDGASDNGTIVCSPKAKDHERIRGGPDDERPLALPPVGGSEPRLATYNLPITAIRNDRGKPESHYMDVPHFRRQTPYS